jgi:hypothetical protein
MITSGGCKHLRRRLRNGSADRRVDRRATEDHVGHHGRGARNTGAISEDSGGYHQVCGRERLTAMKQGVPYAAYEALVRMGDVRPMTSTSGLSRLTAVDNTSPSRASRGDHSNRVRVRPLAPSWRPDG